MFGVGRGTQVDKNWTSNGDNNWGWFCKKWQEYSFVSDNAHKSIAENWSAQHDKSDLIFKK